MGGEQQSQISLPSLVILRSGKGSILIVIKKDPNIKQVIPYCIRQASCEMLTYIITFDPHSDPVKYMQFLSPFYRAGDEGQERVSRLPGIAQLRLEGLGLGSGNLSPKL